jgi:hypothetical protein
MKRSITVSQGDKLRCEDLNGFNHELIFKLLKMANDEGFHGRKIEKFTYMKESPYGPHADEYYELKFE